MMVHLVDAAVAARAVVRVGRLGACALVAPICVRVYVCMYVCVVCVCVCVCVCVYIK